MVGLPGRGGLPGSRVIPDRWEAHHRPVAEGGMTAEVTIRRHTSADATFDPTSGKSTFPAATVVWAGIARIQRMPQLEVTRSIGDRQVVIRGYTVSLPADVPEIMVSDEVTATATATEDRGDPYLAGKPLWVHDVHYGSLMWQRDLTCLNAPPTAR